MPIYVSNLSSGDAVTYSLPLLVGEIRPSLPSQGTICVCNVRNNAEPLSWPVHNGKFKVLVELASGENRIELRHGEEVTVFVLCLKAPELTNFVRPIYIQCDGDSGEFQGPDEEDRSPASAILRISLAARLLQTFTAEKLNDHGLGRRTFALETDLHPTRSPCHVFRSRLTVPEAHSMSGSELWTCFARELMLSDQFRDDRERCKWFAFMSFTRYGVPASAASPASHSEVLALTKGHTALGGGGLALYGTGTLHCWAQNVAEITARFSDCRRIDRTRFMDDSAYREFYWANYATGLGAALHELGHTFDLAHSPTGIMARGFDDIHRVFTVTAATSTCAVRGPMTGCHVRADGPCSRDASPVPSCSPRQSPVRRPSLDCNSPRALGSPRLLRHSSGRPASASELPSVIVFESAFTRLHVQTSNTMRIKNYDGSELTTTTTRHKDGVETVSEVTAWPDGRLMVHELVRNMASGKTRSTMSMCTVQSESDTSHHDGVLQNGASNGASNGCVSTVNNVTTANAALNFQELRYKDGGAHWYRSSAVLLRYHKWFNEDIAKNTVELNGNTARSLAGIRLIELRCIPEGTVCHHWEFVGNSPPTEFIICIDEIRHLVLENDSELAVVVEDDSGSIVKRKMFSCQLRAKNTKGRQVSNSFS